MVSLRTDPHDYSPELMSHFLNPRNTGWLLENDGAGMAGDPDCGDFIVICVIIRNGLIQDARFQVKGCPAAVAVGSIVTSLAIGLLVDEALRIDARAVSEALGGLSPEKLHCSALGILALREALDMSQGPHPRQILQC